MPSEVEDLGAVVVDAHPEAAAVGRQELGRGRRAGHLRDAGGRGGGRGGAHGHVAGQDDRDRAGRGLLPHGGAVEPSHAPKLASSRPPTSAAGSRLTSLSRPTTVVAEDRSVVAPGWPEWPSACEPASFVVLPIEFVPAGSGLFGESAKTPAGQWLLLRCWPA